MSGFRHPAQVDSFSEKKKSKRVLFSQMEKRSPNLGGQTPKTKTMETKCARTSRVVGWGVEVISLAVVYFEILSI